MKQLLSGLTLGLILISLSGPASSGTWVTRTVDRVFTDNQTAKDSVYGDIKRYGGCAARFTKSIAGETGLGSCNPLWVSFDCAAVLSTTSKATANTQYSLAQLAFVASKSLRVEVDGTKKLNGFCYAPAVAVCEPGDC